MIKPWQKLKEGDCVYNLNNDQIHELLYISDDSFYVHPSYYGIVFSGGELFPSGIEYFAELEEYDFTDFRQLCENTFGV